METTVLVMTCDSYDDLWQPFFKCFNKYWVDCPYEVYLGTETKDCEYAKTIKTTGKWTKRVRETLEQIDSEYIVFLLDDFFIRKPVDQKEIEWCINNFDDQTATFDFQNVLDLGYLSGARKGIYRLRRNNTRYLCNCQPSIWDRKKLIAFLQEDMSPWEWEMQIINSPFKHYVNRTGEIINIGYYKDREAWGVVQGKWATEMIDFFKKENIKIDFSKRGFYDIKLSIIIPYYKTLNLTKELLNVLIPQLNHKVEVILIDDGCDEKELDKYPIKIIHQKNGGVSKARNTGLDILTGEYTVFVDSDDLITDDYIEKILYKIETSEFDYCFFSWKYKNGRDVIITDYPPHNNTSIWNCIYKSDTIKTIRFDETLQINEDTDFNKRARVGKKENLRDILYIYNCEREGSLSTMSRKGLITAKRPVETQVIIYRHTLNKMGGIETAMYNACVELKDTYDIVVLYNQADPYQLNRLKELVKCVKHTGQPFKCDWFIYYGSSPQDIEKDIIAKNIHHQCCNNSEVLLYKASSNANVITADSKTSAISYTKVTGDKCGVLHNLFTKPEPKKCFHLMSATRLGTDKGSIGDRIYQFANRLNEREIPFTWEVFTSDTLDASIEGLVKREPKLNVVDYMWNKSFILQLSTNESWGCTPTESLERGVPVIATRYQSVHEQIEHGKNGYILELDMSNMDAVIDLMLKEDLTGFKYKKADSIKEWTDLIGDLGGKKNKYVYDEEKTKVNVKVIEKYNDVELGKVLKEGYTFETTLRRAIYLQDERGLVEIIE